MPAPIVFNDQGIGPGIASFGSSLGQALAFRGKENQKKEQNTQQMSALQDAFSSVNPDAPITEQMGAFQQALVDSGASVTPDTALNYMKLLGAKNSQNKKVDPIQRGQHNTNLKFVAGLQGDARKAMPLLKESASVLEAIKSGNLPGTGAGGVYQGIKNFMFSQSPKEIQTLKTMAKRTLIDLGDTKGVRLTDSKLRMLEQNLFNPNKSEAENLEAYRTWVNLLQDYVTYPEALKVILEKNPDSIYDPLLEDTVMNLADQLKSQRGSLGDQLPQQPSSFADLVRKKYKK